MEKMKERVKIFDTTMRDGEQTPGVVFDREQKVRFGLQLEKLGVDIIEVGFPVNSDSELEAVSRVAQKVRKPIVCALARTVPEDIDAAWKAVMYAQNPRIHVFVSSSDIHMQSQLSKNKDEVKAMAIAGVKKAKNYCLDVEFSAMDATRSDPRFIYELVESAIRAGATTINIPDTVGYAIPDEFALLIKNILDTRNVPSIKKAILSVHCHNDLGNAVSNSLAAITSGARQVECCVNGIGERAGNAALEEVVMNIHTRSDWFSACTGINLNQICPTSKLAEEITGIPISANKPIVGENAFSHESGIHQDGFLKERSTYEIIEPSTVGAGKGDVIIGKTSGRSGVHAKLTELGFDITRDSGEFEKVYLAIKEKVSKGDFSDQSIKEIAEDTLLLKKI